MKPPRIEGIVMKRAFQAERIALCSDNKRNASELAQNVRERDCCSVRQEEDRQGLMMLSLAGHLDILSLKSSGKPLQTSVCFCLFACLRLGCVNN